MTVNLSFSWAMLKTRTLFTSSDTVEFVNVKSKLNADWIAFLILTSKLFFFFLVPSSPIDAILVLNCR